MYYIMLFVFFKSFSTIGGTETAMQTELFKQLIQQKYACKENIRSPFINNLKQTWRQKVSKSDSWANKLQAGAWGKEAESQESDEYTYESGIVRRSDPYNDSDDEGKIWILMVIY